MQRTREQVAKRMELWDRLQAKAKRLFDYLTKRYPALYGLEKEKRSVSRPTIFRRSRSQRG